MALRTPLTVSPHMYIGDSTGRPLDNGMVYFGLPDQDPEHYPINIFSDDGLMIPVSQPVRTKGGYLNDNKGDMAEIHAKELIYSVKVLDQYGRKIFYKGQSMRSNWNDDVIIRIDEAVRQAYTNSSAIAASMVSDAINHTAAIDGILADTFVTATAQSANKVARSQRSKNAEQVSVKDFGALGDGSGATISHWYTIGSLHYRGYANLAAVQVDYPHVTSADDTIDWAASQASLSSEAGCIYAPKGTYVVNRPIKTKHSTSPHSRNSGQVFYGDCIYTQFKRAIGTNGVAERPLEGATNAEKLAIDERNAQLAVFQICGSGNSFSKIYIESSGVGFYLGQDYAQVTNSTATHNTFSQLLIRNCSRGVVFAASEGNHYNHFDNIQFVQNQVDVMMQAGGRWTSNLSNNNRNTFNNIVSSRSMVGLWVESGDTNSIYSWHGESCKAKPTSNTFPEIVNMPVELVSKSCVHIVGGQTNRFFGCHMEANETELYNYGYKNEYYGNGYHEDTPEGTQVIMKTAAGVFISAQSFYNNYISMIANTNSLAFPNKRFGLTLSGGNTAITVDNPIVVKTSPAFTNKTTYTTHDKEISGLAANTTTTTSIWASTVRKGAVSIDVKIVAIDTVANEVLTCSAKIAAIRNNSGTITYYKIIPTGALSATGVNAGGVADLIGLSLSVSGKDLMLNIKAPTFQPLNTIALRTERFYTEPAAV